MAGDPQFKEKHKKYRTERAKLDEQFRQDALEECGIAGHQKAYRCYALAWENGHSAGIGEVLSYLEEFSELLK